MSKVIRKVTSGAVQLTPSFHLGEFIDDALAARHGIDNFPDPLAVLNIHAVAKALETVTKVLGHKHIIIKSAFQSVALNDLLKDSADHLRGASVDFTCPSFGNPLQVLDAIEKAKIPQIVRLEVEHDAWVHLSIQERPHVSS